MALTRLPPALPQFFLASSFVLHHLARVQVPLPPGQPQVVLDLSDQHRLQRAFVWTVSTIVAQLHEAEGVALYLVYRNGRGTYKALVVADALWCGVCQPKEDPVELLQLE